MSIKRKFTVEPALLGLGGQPVRGITLDIGNNPPGATGQAGTIGATGATGATGPTGNPLMQVTSPNGSVWGITVSNNGVLGTTQVSGGGATGEVPGGATGV